MQVSPINNISISNKINFRGTVDKSVVKYLKNACLYSKNPEEAKVITGNILEKLTRFMKTLHKDTVFSVKADPLFQEVELPFENEVALVKTGGKHYFTEFSNKTTNSRFSMSRHQEFVVGGGAKPFDPNGNYVAPFYLDNAITQFDTHVNALVDYFSVNKDADRLLFNNMLRYSRHNFSILPDFLKNIRQSRVEKIAKKIANEFGMEPAEKSSSKFVEYKADNLSSNIQDAYTMTVVLP